MTRPRPLLRTFLGLVLCASMPSLPAAAQVTVQAGPTASSGWDSTRNLVRDGSGRLYCASVRGSGLERRILLARSLDGGDSWTDTGFVFDEVPPLTSIAHATSMVALTISPNGRLHAVWGRYEYPSYYQQFYRWYDPATGTSSNQINLTGVTGTSSAVRTSACEIMADVYGTVWIAGHGTADWTDVLLLTSQSEGAIPSFSNEGTISEFGQAKNTRFTDLGGNLLCSFYGGSPSSTIQFRLFDLHPLGAGWSPQETLGDTTSPPDTQSDIGVDGSNHVHVVYLRRTGGLCELVYRRTDAGWSVPITVASWSDTTPGFVDERCFALTVEWTTQRAYLVYRDFENGGGLVLAVKEWHEPNFAKVLDLTEPSAAPNRFLHLTIRGEPYPISNRTEGFLDISWREEETAPHRLRFLRLQRRAVAYGGLPDGFQAPTEATSPGPELSTILPSNLRAFDELGIDKILAHTFPALDPGGTWQLAAATLSMRLQGQLGSDNDLLRLGFDGSSTFAYEALIQDLSGSSPPVFPAYLTLRLHDLPPSFHGQTNVLPRMNASGRLDVWIGDDTAVDHLELVTYSIQRVSEAMASSVGEATAAQRGPYDVLLVDGATGGARRRVQVELGLPGLVLAVQQPTNPAVTVGPFLLWGYVGTPALGGGISLGPIGDLCILPTSIAWVSGSAPFVTPPTPVWFETELTLQGVILDTSTATVHVTNALTIEVSL